jgi:CheY-specific phosphatase CheX
MPLIRGIQQLSEEAFGNVIKGVRVQTDAPYLVKDQIIFGELISLIPLESSWCRGTMMLQTTQQEVMDMIIAGKTHLTTDISDFRQVNEVLSEITNLIWGKIKSEFFATEDYNENVTTRIQVPTLVNHQEKYISFGSKDPQLCFRYTITDDVDDSLSIVVYQKMVFNLSWCPEEFKESDKATDELVDSGELEFF